MDPDKAYKDRVGISLAKRLEEAIQSKAIDESQASEIADFILDNIDKAKDSAQLIDFLEELAKKWPIFQQVLTLEQGEIQEQHEDKMVEHASTLLKNNNIDEALKVVEQANNSNTGGAN